MPIGKAKQLPVMRSHHDAPVAACAEGQVPGVRAREWRSGCLHRAPWVDCGAGVQCRAQHASQADIFCGGMLALLFQFISSVVFWGTLWCWHTMKTHSMLLKQSSCCNACPPCLLGRRITAAEMHGSMRARVAVPNVVSGQRSPAARRASRFDRLALQVERCGQRCGAR